MGQVEATMATLKDAVRRHRRVLRQYLDTHTSFVEFATPHLWDRTNPHGVTKEQVGLSNLHNYPLADTRTVLNASVTDRYVDLESAISYVQSKLGQTVAFVTPAPISPEAGHTVSTTRPQFTATPYANAYGLDRDYREFRIEHVDTSEVIIVQTQTDHLSLESYLQDNADYRWAVRDVALDGSASKWSAYVDFTVPSFFVGTPGITTTGDAMATTLSPVFTTTPFSADAPTAVHSETRWAVYKGSQAEPVWSLDSTGPHLTSVAIPTRVLDPDTLYWVEAIHVGDDRGPSDPGVLEFRTRPVLIASPEVAIRGQLTAAPVTPLFDVPPRFSVTGDADTFESLQATLYLDDAVVWTETYLYEPLQVEPDVVLVFGREYRLELVYRATYYGPSPTTSLAFTTTTGGSRGYLAATPQTPAGTGYTAVTPGNQWLETRGRHLRSHRQGQTLWTLTLSDIDIHGVAWANALDAYLILYTPSAGAHRIVVACLDRAGGWQRILTSAQVPVGASVSSVVYHGLIDDIYRFSATTSVGVCYFHYAVQDQSTRAMLLTPPTDHTLEGRFMGFFGDTMMGGLSMQTPTGPRVGLFLLDLVTSALQVRSHDLTGTIDDWGYAVTHRDLPNNHLTVDRGDQSVRINASLNVLEIETLSRQVGDIPDPALRDVHPASLTYRRQGHVGYVTPGVVQYTADTPSAIKTLSAPEGEAQIVMGAVGPTELRLSMVLPDGTPFFVNGFDYAHLSDTQIPMLAGYTWDEQPLYRTDHAPYPFSSHVGFQTVPVSSLDAVATLADLQAQTAEGVVWEALVAFQQ